MRRRALVAGILGVVTLLTIYSQQQTPREVPPESLTLFANFGLTAKSQQSWDGSAYFTNARLVSIKGRHFSATDSVNADGSWRCSTRADQVAPYADIHYTEMRPGAAPEVLHHPVGVYLTIEPRDGARVAIHTPQGAIDVPVAEIGRNARLFLDGAASLQRIPSPQLLSNEAYEDDEPSIAVLPDGTVAVAWVAYREQADRVLLRTYSKGSWSPVEEVTERSGDIFRVSVVATSDGALRTIWNQREGQRWHLWSRVRGDSGWSAAERLTSEGNAAFHRAAASGSTVHVVWQSFRGGQSDIYLRTLAGGAWGREVRLSNSRANDWEPAVSAASGGAAHVVWDSYEHGNYDIVYRQVASGMTTPLRQVTSSPRFQAHASVAVDSLGRAWIAWNESGVNWGKDQGFLIPVPMATPLHQRRSIAMAVYDGSRFLAAPAPPHMNYNAEHPQLAFAGNGSLVMTLRHWTRRNARGIGSPQTWENFVTTFDGERWSEPGPLPDSNGWIEKYPQLARDPSGNVWAAWMTDNRPFATMRPGNSDVLAARLEAALSHRAPELGEFREPSEEAIPVHVNESDNIHDIRSYTMSAGSRTYKILRGDMHRHTDISQDFKYDGSLFEVYRYALDAAGFDYIVPTDHQSGYDQEFSWWQHEKYVDLFFQPPHFVPTFGYERSLRYPNGHRNIVRSKRGVRPFPIPPEEASGKAGAEKLYEHLRATDGISMPHSSATAQGTNWRDSDPLVEPLMEIFQGYRNSYEYEGAPRAATELNQHAQKSGWQPEGFWWNALAKGLKLGVQASSDHWSTHISYACLLVEQPTREGLLDAIRRRHAYGATDNIVLDFRARDGDREHIMGDAFRASGNPRFWMRTTGTGVIKQIDLISNQRFLYTSRPGARTATFEFTHAQPPPGESWYYVRVLQEDGQLAWSSPIWVER